MSRTHYLSMSTIDLYTCPARTNGALPLAYMATIMNHAAGGCTVESSYLGNPSEDSVWTKTSCPMWDWTAYDYRIKRPTPDFKVGDYVRTPNVIGRSLRLTGHTGKIESICDDNIAVVLADGSHCGFWSPRQLALASTDEIINYQCAEARHLGAKICVGHNPARLTNAQVQTQDGWRLLDADELKAHGLCGIPVEYWDNRWIGPCVSYANRRWTYRTKLSRAELAALDAPKPVQRVALCADDLPPICWIRFPKSTPTDSCWLVTSVSSLGIFITAVERVHVWRYDQLMSEQAEWSPDRRTWTPCYKTL